MSYTYTEKRELEKDIKSLTRLRRRLMRKSASNTARGYWATGARILANAKRLDSEIEVRFSRLAEMEEELDRQVMKG